MTHGHRHEPGRPLLLLLPSIVLIGVFIYYLIVKNFLTSLTNRQLEQLAAGRYIGFDNYGRLLVRRTSCIPGETCGADRRLHHRDDVLRRPVGALLEKGPRGEGLFRSVYLFPMAISFIAASVAWKWLLNPRSVRTPPGLNQLFQMIGVSRPAGRLVPVERPFNMVAMALPAVWQLSGYVMALFLAGFRGIPDDLREAARIDGATEWQFFRHVHLPAAVTR